MARKTVNYPTVTLVKMMHINLWSIINSWKNQRGGDVIISRNATDTGNSHCLSPSIQLPLYSLSGLITQHYIISKQHTPWCSFPYSFSSYIHYYSKQVWAQ
ncbi:hypothetical protein SK128_002710 [Halocaridina rubra]|uniref:Uncharacterized protein n=1 Tax=Halocaridina rubra TaxID=373956 RepID=A0AAN8WJB4_HALRR